MWCEASRAKVNFGKPFFKGANGSNYLLPHLSQVIVPSVMHINEKHRTKSNEPNLLMTKNKQYSTPNMKLQIKRNLNIE